MNKDRLKDKRLGMGANISRRDFLDGVARTLVASAIPTTLVSADLSPSPSNETAATNSDYPPAKSGMRGQHPGANDVAHRLRDGVFWSTAGSATPLDEHYDLVVIGGGISGLAAAFLYRQRVGPAARVLILENHDDFGGHARRNEFRTGQGRRLIGYGGSESLQTPSFFSPAVKTLLRDIGVDFSRFKTSFFDERWSERRGLKPGLFFAREAFGRDALVPISPSTADWVRKAPLSPSARADLVKLIDHAPDYLPNLARAEKLDALSRITYKDFLINLAKVHPSIADIYQDSTAGWQGVGIDAVTALDAWGDGNPGFGGMDLGTVPHPTMSPSGRLTLTDPDPYIYHFPEGNHGVARALLRALNPEAMPGSTMETLTTNDVRYERLDDAALPVRLRLNSTAVRVRHLGDPASAARVETTYAANGGLYSVSANHVILACWHRVIPYLTDELSAGQREALNDQQKVPLLYGTVQIRNWKAFDSLKVDRFNAAGHFWREIKIDYPVSMGDYRFAQKPENPVLLHLATVPLPSSHRGLSAREQAQAGRALVQGLTFESLERGIRDLLNRSLGAGGFDAARDIEAVTINRWAHGYAYEYMRPWDAFWPTGTLPVELARRGWGRIAIANSDSGAYAYAHSAIDQATRAVRELVGTDADAPAFADFPGPPRADIGLG
jgi:spermidine dehydrogenase